MRTHQWRWVFGGAISCFVIAAEAHGDNVEVFEKYRSIADRNCFGLKEPAAQVPEIRPQAAPTVPKIEFYLTGIVRFGPPGHETTKVYLINKDQTKPAYGDRFFVLFPGERSGDLFLKEVDEKARRVRIEYGGEEQWLSMKENGVPATPRTARILASAAPVAAAARPLAAKPFVASFQNLRIPRLKK